jgi:hypothetical protein
MAIGQKAAKLLWASAAGHCSLCRGKLYFLDADEGQYTIGEMAHIKGDKPGANRHDAKQSDAERDSYSNLILLCPTHHTEIDKPENEKAYPVEALHELKSAHEAWVRDRVNAKAFSDKQGVATSLLPLLIENHEVFKSFGPHSEIARKNPNSDAHKIWLSERLSTIHAGCKIRM